MSITIKGDLGLIYLQKGLVFPKIYEKYIKLIES